MESPGHSGPDVALPAPLTLREPEFGTHVADYLSVLLSEDDTRGFLPSSLISLGAGGWTWSALGATGMFPLAVGIFTTMAVVLPVFALWQKIFRGKYEAFRLAHLEKKDVTVNPDTELQNRYAAIGQTTRERLLKVCRAVDSYNELLGKVELAMRTERLEGKPVTDRPALRAKLSAQRDELLKQIAVLGSLIEAETRNVTVDEPGADLVSASLDENSRLLAVADEMDDLSRRLSADVELLDELEERTESGVRGSENV